MSKTVRLAEAASDRLVFPSWMSADLRALFEAYHFANREAAIDPGDAEKSEDLGFAWNRLMGAVVSPYAPQLDRLDRSVRQLDISLQQIVRALDHRDYEPPRRPLWQRLVRWVKGEKP